MVVQVVWVWVVSDERVFGSRDCGLLRLLSLGRSGVFENVRGVMTLWFDG